MWIFVLAAIVAVGGVGYFGYKFMTRPRPVTAAATTPVVAPVPVKKVEAPKLPPGSLVIENPTSDLGKLVAKVQDTVTQRNASDQIRSVDELTSTRPLPPTPDPIGTGETFGAKPVARATPSGDIPADPTVATQAAATEAPIPDPSPLFRTFVVHMKVSGVFQGDTPRAMLNGRMVKPGDLLDADLGVVFTGINAGRKQLMFKDATGAIMTRRY